MDTATKRQIFQEWWKKSAMLHRPDQVRRVKEEMREDNDRLFAYLKGREEVELRRRLRNLIENAFAFAHYKGLRYGYRLACQLYKFKKQQKVPRAEAAIARLIDRNPKWTTKQIFVALDNAEIRVYPVRKKTRHLRLWSELASEPTYKMLVSRIRSKVRRADHIARWRRIMKDHERLRRSHPFEPR